MKKIFTLLLLLTLSTKLHSEPRMDATIQNMHLWRGGLVAEGFVLTTNLYYTPTSERLKVGFWGGTNSSGEYKEFNYCASYTLKNFEFAISDTYNFSTYATYNNQEFFNYQSDKTGRFLDATVKYHFNESFPLTLSWSTVLFGRDRNTANTLNRFSTFCSVEYPIYNRSDWRVDAGFGGAFTLRKTDTSTNFYGDRAGLVEATLRVSNSISIGGYEIPVTMVAMWNPQSDKAYLQICAQILRF